MNLTDIAQQVSAEITDGGVPVSQQDALAVLNHVSENYTADSIFDKEVLEEWAKENGFVKQEIDTE